jgi:hypothetical protein
MEDRHRIPQRNCGRFSRPSLDLLIGLTRPEPDACHAKERNLVLGSLAQCVNHLAKKIRSIVNNAHAKPTRLDSPH